MDQMEACVGESVLSREKHYLTMARQAAPEVGVDPNRIIMADGIDTKNWKALLAGSGNAREWLACRNSFVRTESDTR